MLKTLWGALIAATLTSATLADDPPSDRLYTITLGPRTACASPTTSRQARAEGGTTDVSVPSGNVLTMIMSGSVAANAFLGQTSTATETFHLEQEFQLSCSEDDSCLVRLTLESSLVGFVRSKFKAGACVKLAQARICLAGSPETPLVVVHPPLCVEGDNGRLCNQNLPPIKINQMPLGKYILVADFVLTSEAGGLSDGHSAADFSPSTSLPADWVRTRDPFQGVDKKDFGFKLILTADPPEGTPQALKAARTRRDDPPATRNPSLASNTRPTPTRPRPAASSGLDRHCGPK